MTTLLKKIAGGKGERANSLFTHPRALEAEICERKNFDLEAHPFLGLSFSISRAWLERTAGRLWNPPVAPSVYSSLACHAWSKHCG